VLRAQVDSATYRANYYDPRGPQDLYFPLPAVPYLKFAAVHDDEARALTLFALNRSLDEELPLRVDAGGFAGLAVERALELCDGDLKALNTAASPDRVKPAPLAGVRATGGTIVATLKPASWNVIRVKLGD
jgi:alpha-N-arabinofuranosidase